MNESTLKRVAAESEIRNLVARLGHLADDGDLQVYLSLFTPDAEWHTPTGEVRRGHTDILAGANERRVTGVQGPGTDSRHVNTTLWVEVGDDGTARAQSYFLYLRSCSTSPVLVSTGRYNDEFRETPDGWKMARRVLVADVNG